MRTPLSVGVVVARQSGLALVEALDRLPQTEVVVLCDRRSRRGAAHAHVPAAVRTSRVQDVLDDERVDAVVVAADVDAGREIALAALAADKHVLVQGLLGTTAADAEALVRKAGACGRVVAPLQASVVHAANREAKSLLALGRLGDVYYVRALAHGSGCADETLWELVGDEVARVVDVLSDEPLEVVAHGSAYGPGDLDVVTCRLRFATGIVAQVDVSLIDPRPLRCAAVVGAVGTALIDTIGPRPLTIHYARPVVDAPLAPDGDVYSPGIERDDPLEHGCALFVRAVRSSGPGFSPRQAVVVAGVVEAIRRSVAEGGTTTSPAAVHRELQLVDAQSATA